MESFFWQLENIKNPPTIITTSSCARMNPIISKPTKNVIRFNALAFEAFSKSPAPAVPSNAAIRSDPAMCGTNCCSLKLHHQFVDSIPLTFIFRSCCGVRFHSGCRAVSKGHGAFRLHKQDRLVHSESRHGEAVALVYTRKATGKVQFEFHGEPDRKPRPDYFEGYMLDKPAQGQLCSGKGHTRHVGVLPA